MNRARFAPQFIFLLFWLVGATLAAQSEAPGADAVLRRMSDFLAAQEAFHFKVGLTFDDVPATGVKLQYSGSMEVFLRRPDRLHLNYRDDLSARKIWIDGETFTLLEPTENLWVEVENEATLDATLERLATHHGLSLPLDDLLVDDPHSRLLSGVKTQRNLGRRLVGGVECHHLVFGQEDLIWQIWVEAGDRPLPRKMVITYKNLPMAPQFSAVFAGWDLGPRLSKERFRPVIPAEAVRVDLVTLEEATP